MLKAEITGFSAKAVRPVATFNFTHRIILYVPFWLKSRTFESGSGL